MTDHGAGGDASLGRAGDGRVDELGLGRLDLPLPLTMTVLVLRRCLEREGRPGDDVGEDDLPAAGPCFREGVSKRAFAGLAGIGLRFSRDRDWR